MSKPVDDDQIHRAIRGDAVALKILLTSHHERICEQIARRIPADVARVISAEDIAQESYIEVFRGISSFQRRGEDAFIRWLATIAMNRLRNAIKHERALKRGGGRTPLCSVAKTLEDSAVAFLDYLVGPEGTPSRHASGKEAVAALKGAIDTIPEHYRKAVWQVHIEGLPVRAVAENLGCTERAIHGLCRRGLDALRCQLKDRSRFLSSTS